MNTMKKLTMVVLVAASTMGTAAVVTTAPAAAREAFVFSFDTGNVAFAYRDGYWDHDHRWHRWHNDREAREFRRAYEARYWHERHDHFRNAGWRDDDHDGVPNRFDDHPENPYRR